MPFANVFGVRRVSAFAQGVRDTDALFGGQADALANVPSISFPEAAALFYHPLHEQKLRWAVMWLQRWNRESRMLRFGKDEHGFTQMHSPFTVYHHNELRFFWQERIGRDLFCFGLRVGSVAVGGEDGGVDGES